MRVIFETLPRMQQPPLSPRAEFYQSHLDRVSRSFAFCIARLDGSLRLNVGLSYLLCRILDTIEDAPWASFSEQEVSFRCFDELISQPLEPSQSVETVARWVAAFPKAGIADGEALLLQDAHRLISDFHALQPDLRESLARSILSMSAGMRHYMGQKAKEGRLVLESAADVNRYCFFVAGVVGEMLTRFLSCEVQPSVHRLRDGFRFGLFLQKVNILKDQSGDEAQGRYLVPSRSMVLSGLLRDADGAFRYLLSLPEKDVGFRLFCAWSLFLGLASLPWIQGVNGDGKKIPRSDTLSLLCEVENRIHDERALQSLFAELRPQMAAENTELAPILQPQNEGQSEDSERQLLALYQGDLSESDVLSLFRSGEV